VFEQLNGISITTKAALNPTVNYDATASDGDKALAAEQDGTCGPHPPGAGGKSCIGREVREIAADENPAEQAETLPAESPPDFFEKSIAFLKPMVLRDVAQDIGMHESTISRVTTNKYAHTTQGIFELTGYMARH
jgi:hypothetical protein